MFGHSQQERLEHSQLNVHLPKKRQLKGEFQRVMSSTHK